MTANDHDLARARAMKQDWRPRSCGWEITLACNLRCGHCGSVAGRPRENELTTQACLGVVEALVDLGCEFVSLTGGEPTVRSDWDVIGRALADRGVTVNMVTNGQCRSVADARTVARRALDAGMCNVGVSIDGLQPTHDRLRGEGAFARAVSSAETFVQQGLPVAVMTTVDRRNLAELGDVRALAIELGATIWRLQLCKPMGTMDTHRSDVIRPSQVVDLVPLLAWFQQKGGIDVRIGDSIGYHGPRDSALRGRGLRRRPGRWMGCQAGLQNIGIQADGTIKGCLSLQPRPDNEDAFIEGSLRDRSLADIWYAPGAFAYNRDLSPAHLTEPCRQCRHRITCRGGARCVSSTFDGTLTGDRYCYHALVRQAQRPHPVSARSTAAAAALLLGLGPVGCQSDSEDRSRDASFDAQPTEVAPGPNRPRDWAFASDYTAPDASPDDGGDEPDIGESWADYTAPPPDAPFDAQPTDVAPGPDRPRDWAFASDYTAPDASPDEGWSEPDIRESRADYGAPIPKILDATAKSASPTAKQPPDRDAGQE